MIRRKVVDVQVASNPRYVDLILSCGHAVAWPRRRREDYYREDYPATARCEQCEDAEEK